MKDHRPFPNVVERHPFVDPTPQNYDPELTSLFFGPSIVFSTSNVSSILRDWKDDDEDESLPENGAHK